MQQSQNLEAFSPGDNMTHMPFAAQKIADFIVKVGFIEQAPDLTKILDAQFVKTLAGQA